MAERVFGNRWGRAGAGAGTFSQNVRQVAAETTVTVSTTTVLSAFTNYRNTYAKIFAFFWNESTTEPITITIEPGEVNSGAVVPDLDHTFTVTVPVKVGAVAGHAAWSASELVHSHLRFSGETASPTYTPANVRWKLMGVERGV